eukprot:854497-Pelagomonas_calceolata.AAC.2
MALQENACAPWKALTCHAVLAAGELAIAKKEWAVAGVTELLCSAARATMHIHVAMLAARVESGEWSDTVLYALVHAQY